MSTGALSLAVALYLAGLLVLRKQRYGLLGYLWGAFGFAALLVLAGLVGEWNEALGELQAGIIVALGNVFGLGLEILAKTSIVTPDPSGWSVLKIGIECSSLIEASVFAGLLLFYPRFPPGERMLRLMAGLGATFLLNLARLSIIVGMVATLGKPAVPWAHTVVGRLVFFLGIVVVYWRMMTMPTLRLVRRDLEVSGRAVR